MAAEYVMDFEAAVKALIQRCFYDDFRESEGPARCPPETAWR
jgi:hypothetical protein